MGGKQKGEGKLGGGGEKDFFFYPAVVGEEAPMSVADDDRENVGGPKKGWGRRG